MKKQEREFWIAVTALAISIVAAGFTGLQWAEARQARIDAQEEAEAQRQQDEKHFDTARQDAQKSADAQEAEVQRSAAAAERSARSSEKSNQIASDSLHLNRQIFQITERAFVHVKSVEFTVAPNQPATVTVAIENVGRTTAKAALAHVNLVLRNRPIADQPEDFPSTTYLSPVDLAAGDNWSVTAKTLDTLSQDEIEDVKRATLLIYCYGHIDYTDAFVNRRKTTFCFQYNSDDPSKSHSCPHYNTVE